MRDVLQKLLSSAAVGYIATALARNIQLFSQAVIPLQNQNFQAQLGGGPSRKHAGRAARPQQQRQFSTFS